MTVRTRVEQIDRDVAVILREDHKDHKLAGTAARRRHGDGGHVLDVGGGSHHAFDLSRADLDAAQVHGVIHTAMRTIAAVRQSLDLIAVPPFWSVGQTIDYMSEAEDLPDRFYEVFVVDPAYHLIGSVALKGDFTASTATFTGSSLSLDDSTVTIVLGTHAGNNALTVTTPGTMAWGPSTTSYDRAANAVSGATANASGSADVEF